MSKISIKTDFADGEKLFAQQLNNNFLVIQAGINANEENLQEVIDQAIIELDHELEEITADRGWDWNGGDRVTFYKGDTQAIEDREIINGQMLYNTDTGETALDDNGNRIVTGSGNVVAISSTQPINEATKDWIKPITINGTETAEEYFKNNNNEWVKILTQPSGDTLPIGSIAQFGGATAPTNWLFCNGQAVSRVTYAELFSIIGTTYGDGDGSTTFNLPDFIGRVPVGLDEEDTDFDTLGETGGSKELQEHNHTFVGSTRLGNPGSGGIGTFIGSGTTTTSSAGTGDSGNLQPYTVINFIIKAKQSIGIVGTVSEDITDTNKDAVPTCETVKEYVDEKQTYSTDEIVVGTWLGKPLYRKVIDCGTLPNAAAKNVAHGISNLSRIIKMYGNATDGTNSIDIPNVHAVSFTSQVAVFVQEENIRITTGSDRSGYNAYVVLEYTKTTD